MENSFAFEQVRTDYPLFAEEVEEWVERQSANEWLISFEEHEDRRTGMGGIAYYAEHFDDEATVEALP